MVIFKFRNLKTGQATPIPPGEFTVGRADDAYVHVPDNSVSRFHAKIFNENDGIYVEDLGSSNGTAAHGTFLTGRAKVDLGDVIHVGSVPFRIDPEVAGEASEAPSAGLRPVSRAYMRQATERLTFAGDSSQVVETLSPEPEVKQVTEADAGQLKTIPIPERAADLSAHLPIIRPGGTPLNRENPAPAATPAPVPQPVVSPKPQPSATPAPAQQFVAPPKPQFQPAVVPQVQSSPAPLAPPTVAKAPAAAPAQRSVPGGPELEPEPATPATPPAGINWGFLLIVFLAGMGAGLLAGLYFAKLFFEMGGKPSGLP